MKLWKLFLRTMKIMGKRCIIYFTAIFLMSTTWAMFSVMSSLLVKSVIDAAQTGNTSQMLQIIVINVIAGIILLIVYRNATITYNVEAKRACGKLYSLLFRNAVRLPYSYYETHHSGEIMSKISYDVEKMASIYGSRFRRMVAPLLQVIVFVIPMFILSWKITLCLIGVNLVMLLINTLLVEPMGKVSKELSFTNKTMTEKLSNLLQGMEQARMYSSGKNTVDEFIEENEKYAKQSNKRIMYIGCLEGCNGGFDLLCALTFLILGVYFVQEGHTTLGAVTAIYTLYNGFSYQFLQLGRYIPEFVGCLVNAENIFNFIDEEKEPDSWYVTEQKNSSKNFMDISNIEFYYSEDKPLIKDYSLYINKGESIAVTGHSGCGKTTLSKLLLSLYPIIKGDISVEEKSYKNISNSDIRKLIAYVPQEPYLFNESIKENIRIGKLDATDEEIVQAAKLAYAHDFIQELENGYDTYAGERGNKLSGGQRQRIAIARAILKDAPIVLLDEATSALDNESERLVNEALKSMKNNKTIIMIAHRPSTIALADRVENFK